MTRHEARINVFSLIFESLFRKDEDADSIWEGSSEDRGVSANTYVKTTYFGVSEKAKELDKLVDSAAENWRVGRMSNTARSVLRLASYELLYTDVPPKAVINEAVEIAKEYADETEASFVNGILNRIAKDKGLFTQDTVSGETEPEDKQ